MNAKLHHFQHFGCPVYVLDHKLQAGRKSGMKWKERVRIGVNLGFSPQHAKSVHLVLSLTSGCVSPQFHCTFDSTFETLKEYSVPESLWQEKAHFVIKDKAQYEKGRKKIATLKSIEPTAMTAAEEQQSDIEVDPQLSMQDKLEPPVQQESSNMNDTTT
jgi:hypothetical protein